MVTGEGRVKILDFGLALVGTQQGVTDAGESTMTESSGIVGTVPYMEPRNRRACRYGDVPDGSTRFGSDALRDGGRPAGVQSGDGGADTDPDHRRRAGTRSPS